MRRVLGQASTAWNSGGGISGGAWSGGGAPWVRRMPSHTVATRAAPVGSGRSAVWCANLFAEIRLPVVPTFAPALASATR